MGFNPFRCYEKCDSDHVAVLGKCWEKKCMPAADFSISATKAVCRRTTTRARDTMSAGCSHLNKPDGTSWIKTFNGRCLVSCKSDETETLGFCWPAATLTVSIEGIVTEFGSVLNALGDVPVGKFDVLCV